MCLSREARLDTWGGCMKSKLRFFYIKFNAFDLVSGVGFDYYERYHSVSARAVVLGLYPKQRTGVVFYSDECTCAIPFEGNVRWRLANGK